MGLHLEEQARLRHDQHMKSEIARLREQLLAMEDRLADVTCRLAVAEDMIGVPRA